MLCPNASLASNSLFTGGGGGFVTVTSVEAFVLKLRESEQDALTVIVPAGAPAVFSLAELPLPETLPPVAVQLETVTGTLSGLVQVAVRLEGVPTCTEVGLDASDMVGGFFGGSLTVKLALQLASPFFFCFGSVTCAVTRSEEHT